MIWESTITTSGDCSACCVAGCIGCVGQTGPNPSTLNVTFNMTNPGIWNVAGYDWSCSDVSGSVLTWDGVMPNDGNCVLDLGLYCPIPLSIPPYVFDYSWFHGKTFTLSLDGTGCTYNMFVECTVTDSSGGVYHTQLSMAIHVNSPTDVKYDLAFSGVYDYTPNPARVSRFVTDVPLTWGCSGSAFSSASASFNFDSPGPGVIAYGSTAAAAGGTVAGSFVVTP